MQRKLHVKKWIDDNYLNTKLRGMKYPGVVEWRLVPDESGGEQIKILWKANM